MRKFYQLLVIISLALVSPASSFALDSAEIGAFSEFLKVLLVTSTSNKAGNICVLGNDEIGSKILYRDKSVISLEENPNKYSTCKAIYVANNSLKYLQSELQKLTNNKTFTVAVFEGFTEAGGMVQVQMGRRNFELTVNSKLLKDSNIKINSLFTNLIIN